MRTGLLEQYKPTTLLLFGEILVDDLITHTFIRKSFAPFVEQQAVLTFCGLISDFCTDDWEIDLRY